MEAQGRARRGYFVRGLSGIQFALPGVVDRLRRSAGDQVRIVAASDPSNAFGPLVPVAGERPYRPSRVPGSWMVTAGGRPILAVEARGRRLIPLADSGLADAVKAFTGLARRSRSGRLAVESWADQPVIGSEGEAVLLEAGFSRGPRRLTYRAPLG
jgi:ATP-dependent Lhr-like helicase